MIPEAPSQAAPDLPAAEPTDRLSYYLRSRAALDDRPVRIWHLSDPHFAPRNESRLESALCRLPGLQGHADHIWNAVTNLPADEKYPDLLIVSGDLSSFGTVRSLRYARTRIGQLANALSLTDDQVLVVPGNHDRFRDHVLPWIGRRKPAFEQVFDEYERPKELLLDGRRIFVYPFDSTESGIRMWPIFSSTGIIDANQFNAFNSEISGRRDDVFIVVLHHHPLPVPGQKLHGLTVMKNGGRFMDHIQEQAVDLVLHGHMHEPYSCRISYREDVQDTVISAAGSACQHGTERCNLSVIDLFPKQKVVVRAYRYSTAGFKIDKDRLRTFRLLP